MTVKVPMMTPVSEPRMWRITPAWSNFRDGLEIPHSTAFKAEVSMFEEALKDYDAVWLRREGMIEFEDEENALMWILRWS